MLNNKNMWKLLIRGQTNNMGNQIFDYANKIMISRITTNSNVFMGLYQTGEIVASIIFNLLGGVIADKKDRKIILICTDLISAIVTFLIFISNLQGNVWILLATNIILAILYSFNGPAYKAIVKDLLTKKNIYKYNSYSKTLSELINVIAPLISMVSINMFGFRFAMLINSLSFMTTAFIEYKFEYISRSQINYSNYTTTKDLKEGFNYIKNDKEILIILITSSIVNFFLAGYNFSLPYINKMSNSTNFYAFTLTAISIGNILGAFLNTLLWKDNLSPSKYNNFLLGVGFPYIFIPIICNFKILVLICITFSMTCLTIFNIQMMSGLQVNIDDRYIGRVFGLIFTTSVLLVPIGTYIFAKLNLMNWIVFMIIGIGEILAYLFMKVAMLIVKKII
ncbi:MFS transporter [Lactobacillus hominis]|uniref:MFS transporter n=1 Tax=Lactobacillus hominis TaxID=1203033 RepID=UPI0026198129|nr:MFS transporter [Lactobacillus hominis]